MRYYRLQAPLEPERSVVISEQEYSDMLHDLELLVLDYESNLSEYDRRSLKNICQYVMATSILDSFED